MKGNVNIDFHIRILWRPLPFKLHPPDRFMMEFFFSNLLWTLEVKVKM
ncbi:hypothetical protein ERO13_D03G048050v2 [Gossypium hirsutum]|nr:hypothetical protein ERO13_D03G048050v2 [Gossypium hirsutum]